MGKLSPEILLNSTSFSKAQGLRKMASFPLPLPLYPGYLLACLPLPALGNTALDLPTSLVMSVWCCQMLSSPGSRQAPVMREAHSSYVPAVNPLLGHLLPCPLLSSQQHLPRQVVVFPHTAKETSH